jgi:cellulose synthase (UDP-forming)
VYVLISDKSREDNPQKLRNKNEIPIAILVPTYNEPQYIVERTIKSCKKVKWPGVVSVYILDDSTTEKDKKNMDLIAKLHGCHIIRRDDRIGYKAGNINNAISKYIKEPYFVILDSDQAPEPEFLEETMNYFSDKNTGFVQTPQHFIDQETLLERAATFGTNIFYHAQSLAKAKDGAMPFCGTNLVVKTEIFRKVNGFAYYTATEDIDLGLRINEAGFIGKYVPKILAKGYAPADFSAYKSQQYRWANGNLAILRENWLKIIGGNFPFRYQVHMLFTTGWWLIGIVSLIYVAVPIVSLFFGWGTHHTWLPTALLLFLFIHIILGLSMIYFSLDNRVYGEKVKASDAFLQYSLIVNSAFIYSWAAINALIFKRYIGFIRTNKLRSVSSLWQIKWNLLLSLICFGSSLYGLYFTAISSDIQQIRTYLPVSVWLLFYSLVFGSSILFVGRNK